jgi:hypothetical protein
VSVNRVTGSAREGHNYDSLRLNSLTEKPAHPFFDAKRLARSGARHEPYVLCGVARGIAPNGFGGMNLLGSDGHLRRSPYLSVIRVEHICYFQYVPKKLADFSGL